MFLNTAAISSQSSTRTRSLPIVLLRRTGETKDTIVEKYVCFSFDLRLCLQVLAFSHGISHQFFLNCFSSSRNVQDTWLRWKQNRMSVFRKYF